MTSERHTSPRSRFNPALLLILLPLLAGMVLTLPAAGVQGTNSYLREALGSEALSLTLVSPLVLFALWRSPSRHRSLLILAVTLHALSTAVLFLPNAPFVPDLSRNWQGKVLDLSWMLLFVVLWKRHTPEQLGLRWQLLPGSLRPVLIATAALTAFNLLSLLENVIPLPDLENVLFELTMPGLTEELFFRGVLLALLNEVFGRPWRLAGARVGWGLVITSVLFGLDHGALWEADSGLFVSPPAFIVTGGFGFVFCWIRERSGSLWPAILAHNLGNVVLFTLPLLRLI